MLQAKVKQILYHKVNEILVEIHVNETKYEQKPTDLFFVRNSHLLH